MDATHFGEDQLASLAIALVQNQDGSVLNSEHLRTCKFCSEKLEFLRQFYSHLAGELLEKHDTSTALPSNAGRHEVVIPFTKFQPPPLAHMAGIGESKLILAAKGQSHSSDRYTTLATYSCVNPPAVLRVLEDRQLHRCKVFILSELPEIRDEVRVSFIDDDGRTITASTNEDGMANFTVPDGFDWAHAQVAVSARISNDRPSTTA